MPIIYREFLTKNIYRNYPFIDTASFIDMDDNIFPQEFIIDIRIIARKKVYLSEVKYEDNPILYFKDEEGNIYHTEIKDRVNNIYDEEDKLKGKIIINTDMNIYMNYKFRDGDMYLVPIVVMPIKNQLKINKLYEDVKIIFDVGSKLRFGSDTIYIDFPGEPLYLLAKCEQYKNIKWEPAQSINNLKPDEYGNIIFRVCDGDKIPIRLYMEGNTLVIKYIGRKYGK